MSFIRQTRKAIVPVSSPVVKCSTPKRRPLRGTPASSKSYFGTPLNMRRTPSDVASASRRNSTGSPGRFIPRRNSMDTEAANFCLFSPAAPTNDWSNEVFDEGPTWGNTSTRQHRRRLACLSEGASERKLLSFGPEPPRKIDPIKQHNSESLSHLIGSTFAKNQRQLPKFPLRVLDLPKLADDFFTHTVCWSSNGQLVAGLESRLYACHLDAKGASMLVDLGGDRHFISVACNANGNILAAGVNDGEIQLWDLKTEKLVHKVLHIHSFKLSNPPASSACRIVCLDWHPIDDILAWGCGFGQVDLLDWRSLASERSLGEVHPGTSVSGLKYSHNGSYLATSNSAHYVCVWDASANNTKPLFKQEAHTSAIRALAWYPFKNSVLASGGGIDDGFIKLWNIHTGEKLSQFSVQAQVCELLWSPETNELLSSQSVRDKHSVVVWDYPQLQKLGCLGGHQGRALHMALSPCKTLLATAAADETLRVWELKPKTVCHKPPVTTTFLQSLR